MSVSSPTIPEQGMLDTNILILRRLIDPAFLPAQAGISAVVLGELAAGVHNIDDAAPNRDLVRSDRIALLQQAEAEFDAFPYTAEAARIYGRMFASVRALGRSPRARTNDLMIAATAAAERLPLFTTNVDDYRGLDHLVQIVAVPRP
ncbi:MAG TPA: type II toxin-antitoxin system VapC family toxin [Arachnia sp.]|nr:type II toxin-antitoxin system VapC family toxin [Arachnia sp.]